jgi:transcriptional regulator with XRE-family HTH domain
MDFISKNIKQLRKLRELSQKQVAMTVGIAQGQYSRIESGKVIPTIPTLAKIASVFEVNLADFFRSTENIEEVDNLPLMEKLKLLAQLDQDEQDALTKIIDIAISKKQMKDSLNQILAS